MWLTPIAGGISAMLLVLASRILVGTVYSKTDAIQLIETVALSGLYLGSAIATASATILALMLTLLGLTRRSDAEFDRPIYRRIGYVGLLSTAALIGTVGLLLFLKLPVGEFEQLPERSFYVLYNILIGITGVLTGLLITLVLLLSATLRQVLQTIAPEFSQGSEETTGAKKVQDC